MNSSPTAKADYFNNDIYGAIAGVLDRIAGCKATTPMSVSEQDVAFSSAQNVGTDEAIYFFKEEWQSTPDLLLKSIDDLKALIKLGEEYNADVSVQKACLYNEEKYGAANLANAIPVAERAVVSYYTDISVVNGSVIATPKFSRATVQSATLDQNGSPQVTIQVTDSANGLVYTYTSSYPATVQPVEPPDQPNPPATPKAFSKAYAPKVSGKATVGKVLTAKVKSWKPKLTGKAWQWQRNGADIPGATGNKYRVAAADLGKAISVVLTGSKAGYKTVTKISKHTKKVKAGTLKKGTVKIAGTQQVGLTLTAKTSKWSSGVTFIYQWYRNNTRVPEAAGTTYTLTTLDRGKRLKVKAIATKPGYRSLARTSNTTGKIR